jgi:RES domain-containing protein
MVLWRVSRHKDLKGIGGLRAPGRWHTAGKPTVYLAESPAGALLEVLVHTASNDIPPDLTLLHVEGPDLAFPVLDVDKLPTDWNINLNTTQDIGDKWLADASSVLLKVPSVIVPRTFNFLFNPLHPQARDFEVRHDYVSHRLCRRQ